MIQSTTASPVGRTLMSRQILFASLLALLPVPGPVMAQDPSHAALIETISKAHHDYYESVKDLSVICSITGFQGDVDLRHGVHEIWRDKQSAFTFLRLTFRRGAENQPRGEGITEFASINRVRGNHRQVMGLSRRDRLWPWTLDSEASFPLSETTAEKFYGIPERCIETLPHLIPLRCSSSWNTSIISLATHPNFRITKRRDSDIKPRLVVIDFVIDSTSESDLKRGFPPIRQGRLALRPDHYWTVASSIIQFVTGKNSFRESQQTMTIEYQPDDANLPRTAKSVILLDKDDRQIEEIDRSKFQFKRYDQLPPETFSLTRFQLPEREPGKGPFNPGLDSGPAPPPGSGWEKRNYLGPSNIFTLPPYAWFTLGALTCLVVVFTPRLFRRKKKPAGSWVQA